MGSTFLLLFSCAFARHTFSEILRLGDGVPSTSDSWVTYFMHPRKFSDNTVCTIEIASPRRLRAFCRQCPLKFDRIFVVGKNRGDYPDNCTALDSCDAIAETFELELSERQRTQLTNSLFIPRVILKIPLKRKRDDHFEKRLKLARLDEACVVCKKNPAVMTVEPCGCNCVCAECSVETCPICDENVESVRETGASGCCICYEKDATVVLFPCLHLCACAACGTKLKGKKCPICRKHVSSVLAPIRS